MQKALMLTLAMGTCLAGMSDLSEFGGFELGAERYWQGPRGGGEGGGTGSGGFFTAGKSNFVHKGEFATRLDVVSTGSGPAKSIAWACIEQVAPCSPRGRLHVNGWFYASDTVSPMAATGSTAQMRVEYYSDTEGKRLIPTRVVLGPSFGPSAGHRLNRWYNISLQDRVPDDAHSLKLSIVLLSPQAGPATESVWIDDVAILQEGRKAAARPSEKPPSAPAP
ncbi:MAG TPA: hypothetical protein VIH35_02170 [Kiritimatiellia bacterium]|jgi:hypothetical protein